MTYDPDKEPEQPAPIMAKYAACMELLHLKGQMAKVIDSLAALLPFIDDQNEMIALQAKICEVKGASSIAEDWRKHISSLEVGHD